MPADNTFMRAFTVSDAVTWGKLVKSWATGESRFPAGTFGDGMMPPKIPQSVDELKAACKTVGLDVTLADFIKEIAVMQYSPGTLAIRLPPRDLVKRSEASFNADADGYPLPQFYSDFFDVKGGPANAAQKQSFHDARIGEYSVNSCG
ncbi:MAG: hypothetical protein ACRC7G_00755 [Beijerinckiaceae bacterium]